MAWPLLTWFFSFSGKHKKKDDVAGIILRKRNFVKMTSCRFMTSSIAGFFAVGIDDVIGNSCDGQEDERRCWRGKGSPQPETSFISLLSKKSLTLTLFSLQLDSKTSEKIEK